MIVTFLIVWIDLAERQWLHQIVLLKSWVVGRLPHKTRIKRHADIAKIGATEFRNSTASTGNVDELVRDPARRAAREQFRETPCRLPGYSIQF